MKTGLAAERQEQEEEKEAKEQKDKIKEPFTEVREQVGK